jgi:hypothetical protein
VIIIAFLFVIPPSAIFPVVYQNVDADSYEDGDQAGCYDAGRDYRGL